MKRGLQILLVIILFIFWQLPTRAQDPHYTQFYSAPLLLNPSLTGMYAGSYRFVGNFRTQWSSISPDAPYRTFAGSFDLHFNVGKVSRDGMGIGVSFYNDKAGDSEFSSTDLMLSIAYQKALNRNGNHYLSIGFQGGMQQRSFNTNNIYFASQFSGDGFDPLADSGESITSDNFMNLDMNAGISWNYNPTDRLNFHAGFALSHLTEPNQSFSDAETVKLYRRKTASFSGGFGIGDASTLVISGLFMQQGPHNEVNLGTGFKWQPGGNVYGESDIALSMGAWLRAGGDVEGGFGVDAVNPVGSVFYKSVQIGVSYDINLSTLSRATTGRGAFELSIIHIGDFNNKKPKNKMLNCPSF